MANSKLKPEDDRLLQLSIEKVESKGDPVGSFHGIKLAGGKWHNCFEGLKPVPKEGELWWANFKNTKGKDGKDYKNLIDMISDHDYMGPRTKEERTDPPASKTEEPAPAVTQEKISDAGSSPIAVPDKPEATKSMTHGERETTREIKIVRQACLKAASNMVQVPLICDTKTLDQLATRVVSLSKAFEKYVFSTGGK